MPNIQKLLISIFAGAGFSKLWGVPLASEIMDFPAIRRKPVPGQWQEDLIDEVEHTWKATSELHKGVVDEFARMLQLKSSSWELSFESFVRFLALRVSLPFWRIGTAQQTRWATGDHIRMQRQIPTGYRELLKALRKTDLAGIVTTNYDLVIEKLLGPLSSGRLGGFNYGEIGERLIGRHHLSSQWGYGPVSITGTLPLLKLHGSLNWEHSDGGIRKYIDARPSRGRKYQALLLPPTSMENLELGSIWERAGSILARSSLWVFCGYSLPPYDRAVKDLLRASTKALKRILILDLNADLVSQRLQELLDPNIGLEIIRGPGITADLDAGDIAPLLEHL